VTAKDPRASASAIGELLDAVVRRYGVDGWPLSTRDTVEALASAARFGVGLLEYFDRNRGAPVHYFDGDEEVVALRAAFERLRRAQESAK